MWSQHFANLLLYRPLSLLYLCSPDWWVLVILHLEKVPPLLSVTIAGLEAWLPGRAVEVLAPVLLRSSYLAAPALIGGAVQSKQCPPTHQPSVLELYLISPLWHHTEPLLNLPSIFYYGVQSINYIAECIQAFYACDKWLIICIVLYLDVFKSSSVHCHVLCKALQQQRVETFMAAGTAIISCRH